MWDPYAEFESITLPNGHSLYVSEWPDRTRQEFSILVHTGAQHDPPGLEGLAHFIEHLVSLNGAMPYQAMREFFVRSGGHAAFGSTGYLDTTYDFSVPAQSEKVRKGLGLFGNLLIGTSLEKAIEAQRDVILQEFNRRFPIRFAFDTALRTRQILHAGTPQERFASPMGHQEAIRRITANDLQQHHQTHYRPANMSIVSVGGMKVAEIRKLVEASEFGTVMGGVRTTRPPIIEKFPPLAETDLFYTFSKLNPPIPREAGMYASGGRLPGTISFSLRGIACRMLNEVLFERIREQRGWTYNIHVESGFTQQFHTFGVECGSFSPTAAPIMHDAVTECIKDTADRTDLFERFRDTLLAQNETLDITAHDLCEEIAANLTNFGRIQTMKEEAEEICAVKHQDVYNLLTPLLDQRLTVMMVP